MTEEPSVSFESRRGAGHLFDETRRRRRALSSEPRARRMETSTELEAGRNSSGAGTGARAVAPQHRKAISSANRLLHRERCSTSPTKPSDACQRCSRQRGPFRTTQGLDTRSLQAEAIAAAQKPVPPPPKAAPPPPPHPKAAALRRNRACAAASTPAPGADPTAPRRRLRGDLMSVSGEDDFVPPTPAPPHPKRPSAPAARARAHDGAGENLSRMRTTSSTSRPSSESELAEDTEQIALSEEEQSLEEILQGVQEGVEQQLDS